MDNGCCLVVMAKAAEPGRVKTRLIRSIGKQRAAQVYRMLLENTLAQLSKDNQCDHLLSCSPDITYADFYTLSRRYGWVRQRQPTGDLGQRMSAIMQRQLRQYSQVIIVGSDLANLTLSTIAEAHGALGYHDIVLGATEDGGYGLIAMKRFHGCLFRNIPWGSSKVSRLSYQRIKQAGLSCKAIDGLWDIDEYKDYRRWLVREIPGFDSG